MANRALQKTPTEIRSLARSFAPMCLRELAGIAQHGESEMARVVACNSLLDRGFGKVAAAIDPEAGDVVVTIRKIVQHIGEPMKTIEHDSELD